MRMWKGSHKMGNFVLLMWLWQVYAFSEQRRNGKLESWAVEIQSNCSFLGPFEVKGDLRLKNETLKLCSLSQSTQQVAFFDLCHWYVDVDCLSPTKFFLRKCAHTDSALGEFCEHSNRCTDSYDINNVIRSIPTLEQQLGEEQLSCLRQLEQREKQQSNTTEDAARLSISNNKSVEISPMATTLKKPSHYLIKDEPEDKQLFPQCDKQRKKFLPLSDFCNRYIVCMNGKRLLKSCPQGSLFNPKTYVCHPSERSPDCATTKVVEKKKLRVRRAISEQVSMEICNTMKQVIGSHTLPHPNYCNKFVICAQGRASFQTCGQGTLFNPLMLVCDHAHLVDCGSRSLDLASYECRPGYNYRTSYLEPGGGCTRFLECNRGTLAIKRCPPATRFNTHSLQCEHWNRVSCKAGISLEHDSNVNYVWGRRTRRSGSLNLHCRKEVTGNYIAPHPLFCDKFVECEESRIFVKDCGPGTVYNSNYGYCDWAYNTRKNVAGNCREYMECVRGRYAIRKCGKAQVFSESRSRCVATRDDSPGECLPPEPWGEIGSVTQIRS